MPGTLITAGMPSSRAAIDIVALHRRRCRTRPPAARKSGVHEVGDGADEDLTGLEAAGIDGLAITRASRRLAAAHRDARELVPAAGRSADIAAGVHVDGSGISRSNQNGGTRSLR